MENYSFRYLHFWQEHIPEEAWANQIWYETKTEILERHLLNLAKRQEKIKRIAKQNNIDEEAVSQFLSGEILQGISTISNKDFENNDETEISADKDPREIITRLKKDLLTFDTIDDFVDTINNYLQSLSDETQHMLDAYVENTMLKVTEGSILGQDSLAGYSSAGKVIAALMGKYSNDAFKIPDNANEQYNTAMGKVVLAAQLIPLCQEEIKSGMIVRHGKTGSTNSGHFEKDIFLLDEVRKKCIAWLREADKTLREVSEGVGIVRSHLKALEANEQIEHFIEQQVSYSHTGNNYYGVNFNPDSELKEILKEVKQKQAYYKKKAKKDFSIDITDEGGVLRIALGANAKNYEKQLTDNLKSYTIKIQDGTPMSTLLGREAGYTGEDMWAILQIASGISRNNDYSEADNKWQFLIKSIGYRSLLNALAGFEDTDDQSFYMVINGNFWTMSNFIEHFLNSSSSVGLSEVANSNGKNLGLVRSTYSNLNQQLWQVDTEGDGILDDAQDRSDLLWRRSLDLMYNTKIRVEITMREISQLMQKVL